MRVLAVMLSPALLACTVLTDLDALRSGSKDASTDGSIDASSSDAIDEPAIDTGTDAGPMNVWVDDFNRPDNAKIGNNWLMKNASSIDIFGNRARVLQPNADYKDNIVYRPASEDVRDVTVSVEVSFTGVPPGYPQIMSRVVQSTVQTPVAFDGYMFFLPNVANEAVIGRQRGSPYLTQLRTIPLNPVVDTSHTYRLTLTTQGANPVALSAVIEVKMGNSWSPIGSDTYLDSDAARLDSAGAVGFGSSGDETAGLYSYDNFTRTSL